MAPGVSGEKNIKREDLGLVFFPLGCHPGCRNCLLPPQIPGGNVTRVQLRGKLDPFLQGGLLLVATKSSLGSTAPLSRGAGGSSQKSWESVAQGFAGIPAGSSSHIPASLPKGKPGEARPPQLRLQGSAASPEEGKSLEKHLEKCWIGSSLRDLSAPALLRSGWFWSGRSEGGRAAGIPEPRANPEFLEMPGIVPGTGKEAGTEQEALSGSGLWQGQGPARFLELFRLCLLGMAGAGAARRDREGILGASGAQEGRGVRAGSLRHLGDILGDILGKVIAAFPQPAWREGRERK